MLQFLADYRSSLQETWANGAFQTENPNVSFTLNADGSARCQVYQDLINLKYEDILRFYYPDFGRPQTTEEEGDGGGEHF